jgi:hypothetical protein
MNQTNTTAMLRMATSLGLRELNEHFVQLYEVIEMQVLKLI